MKLPTSLDALRPLIGHWHTRGTVFDDHGAVVGALAGTDTYAVLPGVPWIAHTVEVEMPDGHVSTYELIGGVHPDGGWNMYAFDDASDQPSVMRLTAEPDARLLLHGDGVRSWFSPTAGADHMEARWERRVGDAWVTWMELRFDRA